MLQNRNINEPAHNKTNNKTCVTSKDSDKSVHPPSMARIFVYLSLDSLKAVQGTGDQQRLWSDCVDAQADLSLCWSHKSYCRFCRALAQMPLMVEKLIHNMLISKKLNTSYFILKQNSSTVKPVLKATCIKQSPIFKGQFSRSKRRKKRVNLHVLSKHLS